MKKFLCLLLSLICVCFVFTACSQSEATPETTVNDSSSTDSLNNNDKVEETPVATEKVEETPALEDLFDWQNVDGGIEITKYKGSSKIIEVPEIIENKKVVSVSNAFEGNVVVETLILPKYVEKVNLSECESLKRVEWTAERHLSSGHKNTFPACIEELVLPNAKSFSIASCIVDGGKNLKKLDVSSAGFLVVDTFSGVDDEHFESKLLSEISISQNAKFLIMENDKYDNSNRVYLNDESNSNDEVGCEEITDENRDEIFKYLFGENVKVTLK